MKVKAKRESTKLAEKAMQRAALGVLGKAVRDEETIPIWDGEKVVWKVPKEEFEQVNAAYASSGRDVD
ncbi:MAG TPA: hypothetical protein PLK94_13930 [Alphaproteobacteria bacterium]|nr:hypothetical protein [Alphaproteobacteria bacterium]